MLETKIYFDDPYIEEAKEKIVAEGKISVGRRFWITNSGFCPCIYIDAQEFLDESYDDFSYDDIPIDVHGGWTFVGKHSILDRYVVGFDYGHYGDYMPIYEFGTISGGKKYTVGQLILHATQAAVKFEEFAKTKEGERL